MRLGTKKFRIAEVGGQQLDDEVYKTVELECDVVFIKRKKVAMRGFG
jgi:hypothetical protein